MKVHRAWAGSSAVERWPYKPDVAGSKPVPPTNRNFGPDSSRRNQLRAFCCLWRRANVPARDDIRAFARAYSHLPKPPVPHWHSAQTWGLLGSLDNTMTWNHIQRTSPAEVLSMARTAGQLRRFRTAEPHVRQRLSERGATIKCLCRSLQTAKKATLQDNGRWRLDGGVDSDGEELSLIVELRDGVLVVTLF